MEDYLMYKFNFAESFGVYKWCTVFEKENKNSVLFAHITGGEWKSIKNPINKQSIYNFSLNEKKPDFVIHIDPINVLLLGEAKITLSKLYNDIVKHLNIIQILKKIFSKKSSAWENTQSCIVPTFMWCSEKKVSSTKDVEKFFNEVKSKYLNNFDSEDLIVVGLEVLRDENMCLETKSHIFCSKKSEISDKLIKYIKGLSSLGCTIYNKDYIT